MGKLGCEIVGVIYTTTGMESGVIGVRFFASAWREYCMFMNVSFFVFASGG